MAGKINAADLPPAVRKQLGIPRLPKAPARFTKDDVRGFAIKMLATCDHLTQAERRRVLAHATRINNV